MAQPQEVHDPPCTPNRNMHDRVNNQIQLNRRDINIGSSNGSNIAQEAQIVTQPSVTNVTDMMNVTFAQVQYPIQAIQSAVSFGSISGRFEGWLDVLIDVVIVLYESSVLLFRN